MITLLPGMVSTFIMIIMFNTVFGQTSQNASIFYHQTAKDWSSEALPIGNGRMGAMLFVGVSQERIQFNEQSLWSGDNNRDGEYKIGDQGFGSYRNFGEIVINFSNRNEVTGYHDYYSSCFHMVVIWHILDIKTFFSA